MVIMVLMFIMVEMVIMVELVIIVGMDNMVVLVVMTFELDFPGNLCRAAFAILFLDVANAPACLNAPKFDSGDFPY